MTRYEFLSLIPGALLALLGIDQVAKAEPQRLPLRGKHARLTIIDEIPTRAFYSGQTIAMRRDGVYVYGGLTPEEQEENHRRGRELWTQNSRRIVLVPWE